MRVEIAPGQGVLGRVVAEQRATGDSCGLRNVVDAHLVEAARGEQIDCDIADVVPGGRAPATDTMPGFRPHRSPLFHFGTRCHIIAISITIVEVLCNERWTL